jgi:hypothetical protein
MRVCACESRPTRGPPLALNILPRPDPYQIPYATLGAHRHVDTRSSANTKNDDSKGLLLCSCLLLAHGADGTRSPSQGGGKVQCTRPARAPRRRVASLPRLAGCQCQGRGLVGRQLAARGRVSSGIGRRIGGRCRALTSRAGLPARVATLSRRACASLGSMESPRPSRSLVATTPLNKSPSAVAASDPPPPVIKTRRPPCHLTFRNLASSARGSFPPSNN